MRRIDSAMPGALAVADAVEHHLRPGERSRLFLERTARRSLAVQTESGRKGLSVHDGSHSGYLALAADGRECYLNLPEVTVPDVPELIALGRELHGLAEGLPSYAPAADPRTTAVAFEGHWETGLPLDLETFAADPSPVVDVIRSAAGSSALLQSVHLTEIVGESLFARSHGARAAGVRRGVELQAVARCPDTGSTTVLTRYAAGLDTVDVEGLGRELALATGSDASGARAFDGDQVVFSPTATAQLLQHLTTTLLVTPLTGAGPLRTAVIDDPTAPGGRAAGAFDCEGTATARTELVGRDGTQNRVASRLRALPGTAGGEAGPLTGHARWDPAESFPKPSAHNVGLAPCGTVPDPYAGEHAVVVDVRSLGVGLLRSGGRLAFRLRIVRTVDGRRREVFAPLAVAGGAGDFLAAVLAVGESVSYAPGPLSTAAAPLVMSLSGLTLAP
ncbi:metallopeptidase TldD-related protein [Streptomyces sp. NPDC058955]|uniref:metallopeptidase TldD-related protein n=1 Tax=unclassified Streptomyces TaxID=2593676 RepID=UPI003658031C